MSGRKVSVPRCLLMQLAPEAPMNQDEQGGCVWCGGTPPRQTYGYAFRSPSHHMKGCPWVMARALLDDHLTIEDAYPEELCRDCGGKHQ